LTNQSAAHYYYYYPKRAGRFISGRLFLGSSSGTRRTTLEGWPAVGWLAQYLWVVKGFYIVGCIDVPLGLVEQMRLEQAVGSFGQTFFLLWSCTFAVG